VLLYRGKSGQIALAALIPPGVSLHYPRQPCPSGQAPSRRALGLHETPGAGVRRAKFG